jgi:4-hydroxy-tetrahydrodipicolinate synthase
LATPFETGGSIDWPRFCSHAARLLSTGMNVVTAFGTTGEGVSIARTERDLLYDRMSKAGVPPRRLVECVYGPSSSEAGEQVRRALGNGVAGVLLTPPFYFKDVPEEGIFRWYAEVFETAGSACRDIIVYNIPAVTGVTIGPDLVSRLREAFPGVVGGVKDSSGDWTQTEALLAAHRDIAILVGHEGHLARAVQNGASGAISGIANFAPDLIARLVAGSHDPAIDRILSRLLALPVVPAIKAILASQYGAEAWLRVRAPLLPVTDPGQLSACRALA